ncbi:MAG: chromate transporter [Clostridia bacterium]|nr:chromate transporter [Clostridia bacterium]
MTDFILLLIEFFKTGLFAVGGGLATIPFLQNMSEKYPHWFTSAELTDMIAVSESTPGPIGINMASFAGYRIAGIPGAICATISIVLPCYIIICIISKILAEFSNNKYVIGAFSGIRPAVPGLICAAVIPLLNTAVIDSTAAGFLSSVRIDAVLIFIGVFAAFSIFKKAHPLIFIALGATAGILLKM